MGAAIGLGVGALVYFATREARAEPGPTPEPGPQPGPGPGPSPSPLPPSGTVPAKGPIPYNVALFPDPGTTAGLLADLSPSYSAAVSGEFQGDAAQVAGFETATAKFQNDWNALATQNALAPSRLNSSRLSPDGSMGPQTLRALEWALGMGGWPA